MRQTIAELSIDTRLIIERLDKAAIGDVVSYSELSGIIGRDISTAYHLTRTARKKLLASKKYFEPVPGVGFKRCNDSEKVASGGTYITKSRRACKRGATITTSVDNYDTMSKDDQIRHNSQLSLMLTIRAMSTPSKLKAIESRVEDAQQSLTMKKTLDAIASSKKPAKAKNANGVAEERLPIEVK